MSKDNKQPSPEEVDEAVTILVNAIEKGISWKDALKQILLDNSQLNQEDILATFEKDLLCDPAKYQENHLDELEWERTQGIQRDDQELDLDFYDADEGDNEIQTLKRMYSEQNAE